MFKVRSEPTHLKYTKETTSVVHATGYMDGIWNKSVSG